MGVLKLNNRPYKEGIKTSAFCFFAIAAELNNRPYKEGIKTN